MSRSFGVTEFVKGIGSGVVGTGAFPVLALPRTLRHLPRAVAASYSRVWRENRIGPNLKGVAFATIPIGAVLVVPLAAVGSVGYGFFGGAYRGAEKGPIDAIKRLNSDAADVDRKFVQEMLPELEEYAPTPLPEGKKPFDISLLRAAKGVITGAGTALVGGALLGATTVLRIPQIWFKAMRTIFGGRDGMFLFDLFLAILATVAAVIAPFLVVTGAALFSLGAGVKRGYSDGFFSAWAHVFRDVVDWNKALGEFASGMK